eukprot:2978394-Prymnesium_polylepis.2
MCGVARMRGGPADAPSTPPATCASLFICLLCGCVCVHTQSLSQSLSGARLSVRRGGSSMYSSCPVCAVAPLDARRGSAKKCVACTTRVFSP